MMTSNSETSVIVAMKIKTEKLSTKTGKLLQTKVSWKKKHWIDEATDTSKFIFLAQDTKDQDLEKNGSKCFYRLPLEKIENLVKTLEDENNLYLYEILPANLPVKPYFDLEMERADFDDDAIFDCFDIFCNWYIREIKDIFGIELKKRRLCDIKQLQKKQIIISPNSQCKILLW